MYERLERDDSLVSWMIAGGARYDEPDTRFVQHVVALRDAKRQTGRSFPPIAWLSARLARGTGAAASAAGKAAAALPASSTSCCPA